MTTKNTKVKAKKVMKKVTKTVVKTEKKNIVLTLGQAQKLQASLSKANKNYKFLDAKVAAFNA